MSDTPNWDFWNKINKLHTQKQIDMEINKIFSLAKGEPHARNQVDAWKLSLLLAKRAILEGNTNDQVRNYESMAQHEKI